MRRIALLLGLLAAFIPVSVMFYRLAVTRRAARVDTIYDNIYINGVAVGGLTQADAAQKLSAHFQPLLDKKTIRYTANGKVLASLSFADFDARYDFSNLCALAWQYGRTGRTAENYRAIRKLSQGAHEVNGTPDYSFDPAQVDAKMQKLAETYYLAPTNARWEMKNRRINTVPGVAGRRADAADAARQTGTLLAAQSEGEVTVASEAVAPEYTEKDFSFAETLIGQYQTYYQDNPGEARAVNLRVAAERINNRMLYPGEVFSAAAVLQSGRLELGYAKATVIVNGQAVDDYGGGVCQAVTALYNAVLLAELPVVERFNHSIKVSYADYGFDATVAGDYFDLKFKNDTPHPLLIVCEANRGTLTVGLYGFEMHKPGRSLEFVGELTETLPPAPDKTVIDASIPAGQTVVTSEGQNGYRYEVYKYIYENGQPMGREKVNTSVYKPVQGVVSVGG